jgi:hypothetical protein
MPQEGKVYFETEDKVSVIEGIQDVAEFLSERAKLANAMGYDAKIKDGMVYIFDGGVLYGTYFQHKHMN